MRSATDNPLHHDPISAGVHVCTWIPELRRVQTVQEQEHQASSEGTNQALKQPIYYIKYYGGTHNYSTNSFIGS